MGVYLTSFAILLVFVTACIGWGAVLVRRSSNLLLDLGLMGSAGMAVLVCVGGWLNLWACVSKTACGVLLIGGSGLAVLTLARRHRDVTAVARTVIRAAWRDPLVLVLALTVVAAVAVRVMASLHSVGFNPHDDFHGYFPIVERLSTAGSLGQDPYCQRQIVSSLGGQSFLLCFLRYWGSWENMKALDGGAAFALLLLMMTGIVQQVRAAAAVRLLLLICMAMLWPSYVDMNVSSAFTGAVCILGLYIVLSTADRTGAREDCRTLCLMAVLAAGGCALKTSFVPTIGVILAGFAGMVVARQSARMATILGLSASGLLLVFLLLPWMLAMYFSAGTFLYPFFGKGGYVSSYTGVPFVTLAGMAQTLPAMVYQLTYPALVCFGILLAAYIAVLVTATRVAQADVAVGIVAAGAAAGVAATTLAIGGYDVARYSFPIIVCPMLLITCRLLSPQLLGQGVDTLSWRPLVPGFAVGLLFALGLTFFHPQLKALSSSWNPRKHLLSSGTATAYQRLQEAVPPGVPFLARLDLPFLLDFRRNRVFLADSPGEVSPPPGMPLGQGSEALASYLVSHEARYVAYSYRSQCGFTGEAMASRLLPKGSSYLRAQTQMVLGVQKTLAELGQTRKRIYDDGEMFVLDLSQRVSAPPAVRENGPPPGLRP